MISIAILGATGHIGRALADHYARRDDVQLNLYSRRPHVTRAAFAAHKRANHIRHAALDQFGHGQGHADLIINAIGIGDPAAARVAGPDFYNLTMHFEDRIDQALIGNSSCLTVFLSSGAIYHSLDKAPADPETPACLPINKMEANHWYGATKLAAELRHRARSGRRILDIRVFGFVSPFMDLTADYLICDAINALCNRRVMLTSPNDIVRDYIGTKELTSLIDVAMDHAFLNLAVDTYSLAAVGKFELLERLSNVGLDWKVDEMRADLGGRAQYWSRNQRAGDIGYRPGRPAIDIVAETVEQLVRGR